MTNSDIKYQKVILGDICEFIGGSQPPKEHFSSLKKEGYIRLVQTRDYKTDSFITYVPKNRVRRFCSADDIMIGRYGPPIFQILRGIEGAYNVALMKAIPKEGVRKEYLYYFLKQNHLFEYVDSLSPRTGGQTGVDLTSLKNYPVLLPTPEYQKDIENILGTLDEQISVNNKINAELEAMAKLIYDYWFVQFDFPISKEQAAAMGKPELEGKPYKASGGKMVFNEKLKREIPKGWEVKKLSFYLETELGGTPSTTINEYWNGGIPWLNSGEIANFPVVKAEENITLQGIQNSATSLMPKGTCVLSITRHLRPSILAVDACANQSVVGIYENDKFKYTFIYPFLKNEIPRLMSLRTGAQQPHINKGTVDNSPYVDPPSELLKKYYTQVNSMYERIIIAAKENQKLTELRDWLLPMLMNGQVTIKETESPDSYREVSMAAEPREGYGK